jgi:hypothetical protein
MALEELQALTQQVLQFLIAGRGDQRILQRAVDGFMIRDLVLDIGFVVIGALQRPHRLQLVLGLLGERATGVIVFRLDLQLFDERQRLLVDGGMIAHHVVGKSPDVLVL